MSVLILFNFWAATFSNGFASVLTNGVLQVSHSLDPLISETIPNSAYHRCMTENAGFFSDGCGALAQTLQKKMNLLASESDVQIQSEKLESRPNKLTVSRIAILSRVNLLATQAEEALKTYESKEDFPAIFSTIQKAQVSVAAYQNLISNGSN